MLFLSLEIASAEEDNPPINHSAYKKDNLVQHDTGPKTQESTHMYQ